MKHHLRLLALFTAVLLTCLSLTGCGALDDARAAHGFWNDTAIQLNDSTYRALTDSDCLYPDFEYFENYVHVTDEGVPVLLKAFWGDLFYISKNGLFLMDSENATLYCHSDKYDEIADQLANGFEAEVYCYWSYNSEDETVYTLTQDETLAVSAVMATVEPTVMPGGVSLDYTHLAEVYACTADHLLREYVYDVVEMDGTYYVTYFGQTETLLYAVPAQYAATFDHLLQAQREADASWDTWYEDEFDV